MSGRALEDLVVALIFTHGGLSDLEVHALVRLFRPHVRTRAIARALERARRRGTIVHTPSPLVLTLGPKP